MHGNTDRVRAIINHGVAHDVGDSLIKAVEGEHEEVLRLLLCSFTPLDKELRKQALDVARKEGLLSIARILEGHI